MAAVTAELDQATAVVATELYFDAAVALAEDARRRFPIRLGHKASSLSNLVSLCNRGWTLAAFGEQRVRRTHDAFAGYLGRRGFHARDRSGTDAALGRGAGGIMRSTSRRLL